MYPPRIRPEESPPPERDRLSTALGAGILLAVIVMGWIAIRLFRFDSHGERDDDPRRLPHVKSQEVKRS